MAPWTTWPASAAEIPISAQISLSGVVGCSSQGSLNQATCQSGFLDIFIASCHKDTLATYWVRYLGTSSFNEYSYTLQVLQDGTIFALGQISANGFTNGNLDLLLMSLTIEGDTKFIENIGGSIVDSPGGMIYSSTTQKATIFGNTNSLSFKN
jgi:hypothetical protein